MGNGVGTESERLAGAGGLAATPKPKKISVKTASQKHPSTTMSSDDAPQKEQETVVKAIPAESYSGPPTVKAKELKGTQPWGELHSMNEQLGNLYLGSSIVVIGRRRDCTLRLQDPLISGKHCMITRQIYKGAGEQIECYFLLDTRLTLEPKKLAMH